MDVPEISLYVHVPFCRGRCSYCDFYSVTSTAWAAAVVDRTLEDAADWLERLGRPRLATVYVGGGTPSALARTDLERLLAGIRRFWRGTPAEMTVEANPETVDSTFIEICATHGVSRLSLGVQTLAPELLSLLARRATREQTLAGLELVASRWTGALSVDLLAGIPGQSEQVLRRDIEAVLAFSPGHVSLYSLTREEGTPYDRRIASGRLREPSVEEQEKVWLAGVRELRGRGFRHYEISNFARKGAECLHNIRTWRLDPYLGVGPAAVSTLAGGSTGVIRVSRPRSIVGYLQGAPFEVEEIGERDFFFETLMMGLRLARGVSARLVGERFGEATLEWLTALWSRLAPSRGTRMTAGRFSLTRRGWLLLSGLLELILGEIPGAPVRDRPRWPDSPAHAAWGAGSATGGPVVT